MDGDGSGDSEAEGVVVAGREKDTAMALVGSVLVVLGAWLVLAAPVALILARFLHAGGEHDARHKCNRRYVGQRSATS